MTLPTPDEIGGWPVELLAWLATPFGELRPRAKPARPTHRERGNATQAERWRSEGALVARGRRS